MDFLTNFKRTYLPLNKIEVSRSALLQNYKYISRINREVSIAPVLKSNAYGHGLQLVGKVLDTVGASFFCVDSLYEAYELYKAKIKTPILIMGYTNPHNLKLKKLPFSFSVFDRETAYILNNYQSPAKVHIFVDTGMRREGIAINDLPEFLSYLKTLKNIKIEGLMSHFAASDQHNNNLTKLQVKNFQLAQKIFEDADIHPKWIHMGNSAANLLPKIYKGKIGTMLRAGIASYGIGGEIDDKNLHPAMRVVTTLSQIKQLKKGEKTGYDFTYTAKKDMTIGVLPYGYYDGLDRRLSNKGSVLISGIKCPILGRVSMNITTIDISKVKNPQIGQEVIVYSNIPSDPNSFANVSLLTGTIQRDLFVHLTESTKRVIVA